jgi:hypothetical protein
MPLANDDDVIETFPSDRADQPTAPRLVGRGWMRRMKAAPYAPSRSRIK